MKKIKALFVCFLFLFTTAAIAQSTAQCIINATANGVEMPAPGCGYISFSTVHELLDDPQVPGSVKAYLLIHHHQWICEQGCSQPGGPLGGSLEVFNSILDIEIQGAGPWAGYVGNVTLESPTVTATGPRDPFAPHQDFPNMMVSLNAEGFGLGDLDYIRITAGTDNGFMSDGWTSVHQVGPNQYQVDSQFNIEYGIEMMGNPFGPLAGLEGASMGMVDMMVTGDEGLPPVDEEPLPTETPDE